jgi:hypothetical protein
VFVQLNGLLPTREEDVQGKAYSCHMFSVEKFLATGEHDKFNLDSFLMETNKIKNCFPIVLRPQQHYIQLWLA